MKRLVMLLLIAFLIPTLPAISLEECLTHLRQNTPLKDNQAIVAEQKAGQERMLQAAYYPSLSLSADLGYNSEVTKIQLGSSAPFSLPVPDKDRQSIGIELRQMLWDSGITSLQKQVNTLQSEAKAADVIASIHQREMEAVASYFQVIACSDGLAILDLQKATLTAKLIQVEAAKGLGIREASDVQILQHDIYNLEDQIQSLQKLKAAAIDRLSRLCGLPLAMNSSFTIPEIAESEAALFNRAELSKWESLAEAQRLNARLAKRKNLPQIYARANAGYGKPGYDIFSTDWHDYYAVSIGFSWKLWDFGQRQEESRIAAQEAELAVANQANLLISLQNEISAVDYEIQGLQNSLSRSQQRELLLEDILAAYSEKYDAGVITTTELLYHTNLLLSARLERQSSQNQILALEAKKRLVWGDKL